MLGTATCLLLTRPIARLTLVPFAVLAPFMIVIVYFAAFQTTRAWEDLVALFVFGVLGCYMKRFGWSPPALLIGFVLAQRLDASVYQSIQVYGMSFLERGGVQVILVLIAVSVVVAVRLNPHREPLTAQGLHAPRNRVPQAAFLAFLTAGVIYALYDMSHMAFLGIVFPMAVGFITLALMIAIAVVLFRTKPSYALYDKEHASAGDAKPPYSELHVQGWILALLAAIATLGFILGVFLYIAVFLRVKAQVKWSSAILSALGAVALFAGLGHLLVLDYPEGLLQYWVDLPWPIG